MAITKLGDHTTLVMGKGSGWILDAGCRFWDFTNAARKKYPNKSILALDIADVGIPPDGVVFERVALLGKDMPGVYNPSTVECHTWGDGIGTHVAFGRRNKQAPPKPSKFTVNWKTLEQIMIEHNIEEFDLMKLDIEGSEVHVLLSLTRPVAKQISVEFHEHCFDGQDVAGVISHLSQWYVLYQAQPLDYLFIRKA